MRELTLLILIVIMRELTLLILSNQVWCWDITWLPGSAQGLFYYLYLIMDLYSRKIVAWEIHESESSDLAARLIRKACLAEGIVAQPLVLHSDNGSPMKGSSLLETLRQLGVTSSFSRPRVSNDNAYAEWFFEELCEGLWGHFQATTIKQYAISESIE